jgi:hypothetical protein
MFTAYWCAPHQTLFVHAWAVQGPAEVIRWLPCMLQCLVRSELRLVWGLLLTLCKATCMQFREKTTSSERFLIARVFLLHL